MVQAEQTVAVVGPNFRSDAITSPKQNRQPEYPSNALTVAWSGPIRIGIIKLLITEVMCVNESLLAAAIKYSRVLSFIYFHSTASLPSVLGRG